jgi:hypothetical protein
MVVKLLQMITKEVPSTLGADVTIASILTYHQPVANATDGTGSSQSATPPVVVPHVILG